MSKITRPAEITTCFDRLAADLHRIVQGRPVLFFVNPGNWGDSLIRQGAEDFLRQNGFAFHTARFGDVLKKRTTVAAEAAKAGGNPVMIYCGNGAFSGHYALPGQIAALTRSFETSVILPSTFALDVAALGFSATTTFYVRDQSESAARMPGAMFCHDMAFFLEPEAAPVGAGEGWFLRDDPERPAGTPLHRSNVDLSRLGRAYSPVEPLFRRLAGLRTVHTNRLHVGIAAALLGKDVRLYSNDYFKIRAIFEASLAPYYPNATFAPTFDVAVGDTRKWYHRFLP